MNYREHIAQETAALLERDPKAVVMGAGVSDHKGIFNTTKLARDRFPDRVIETPLSENMLTGALVGMAVNGYRPIFVHARSDFTTLSAEHLINTAAKWSYIHKGQACPITIRCIIGQGFGQGTQHSQSLAPMFANVPGVDVFMPVTASGIRRALNNAAETGRPTVIFEHRRLYEEPCFQGNGYHSSERRQRYAESYNPPHWPSGPDYPPRVVIYAMSAAALDARLAVDILSTMSVTAQLIVPESVGDGVWIQTPMTEAVIIVDVGQQFAGLSAEYAAQIVERYPGVKVARLTPPAYPCPTSYPLEQDWYAHIGADAIVRKACEMLGIAPPESVAKQEAFAPAGGSPF